MSDAYVYCCFAQSTLVADSELFRDYVRVQRREYDRAQDEQHEQWERDRKQIEETRRRVAQLAHEEDEAAAQTSQTGT